MANNAAHPYLSAFTDFIPDPNAPLLADFDRLARLQGWSCNTKQFKKERNAYLKVEFDIYLGILDTEDELVRLQALCKDLGVRRPRKQLDSLTKCKKAGQPQLQCLIMPVSSQLKSFIFRP